MDICACLKLVLWLLTLWTVALFRSVYGVDE